jgi:hypothetical protein
MSVSESQPAVPKPRLRWHQFSLRTLLAFVTLCAVFCSWRVTQFRKADGQEKAIWSILGTGGTVAIESPDSPTSAPLYLTGNTFPKGWLEEQRKRHSQPLWWRVLFANQHLENVRELTIGRFLPAEAALESLPWLATVRQLSIVSNSKTGDWFTDEKLKHLEPLSRLERLELIGAAITDTGLEQLTTLTRLTYLNLSGTQVTDAGINKLQQALPNCTIER